jgi:hypothetical protein
MVEPHDLDVSDVDAAVAGCSASNSCTTPASRSSSSWPSPCCAWLLCSPDVMRGQLDRLQTVVGVPNLRFGILPLGVQLATTPQNSFQMYDDLAIVSTFVGETTYRDDEAAYA